MSASRSCSLLAASLALLSACGRDSGPASTSAQNAGTSPNAAPRRPDVLVISIDSLRADHVGCYGYAKPTTPNLDRFAKEGTRFATAVSTTSWTLPAHAALFTGLFDSVHGVVDDAFALSPRANTLAERLHAAGWRTAGCYGGPYLHPVFGLAQGFERWESCMTAALTLPRDELVKRVLDPAETLSARDVTGPRTAETVDALLRDFPADEPLFLFVHLWDVHYDYRPPESYWRRFDPDYAGAFDGRDLAHDASIARTMPKRELEHLVALYDGEIAFTDEIAGRILAAWDAKRGRERSLVVVTGDHGEEFFEHGGKGHQRTLFEESIRIPLLARMPGRFEGGRVVEPLTRLVDVAPTILAAAGLAPDAELDGRDLAPLAAGRAEEPRTALCELLCDGGEIRALRRATTKTIRYKDDFALFQIDLERDPRELDPLPEGSDALRKGLAELDTAVRAAKERAKRLELAPLPIVLEDAVRRSLRGLGYDGADESEPR
ncbi:MAG: sulfatase [Planctomycetota bacterium]